MRLATGFAAVLALAATAPAQDGGAVTAIVGGTVLTCGPQGTIDGGTVILEGGRIRAVGRDLPVPDGARVVEARGRFVMPGIVDTHSHMGVYSWPWSDAHSDGNEATSPTTPEVRAADSVRVSDPAFALARAGGVTTIMVLPGSANLIGGEACTLKLRPADTLSAMLFEGAPRNMKMASGENPKRVYGKRTQAPSTRMGSAAYLRQAFTDAREYADKFRRYEEKRLRAMEDGEPEPDPPETDLRKQALADIVEGRVRVHLHGYTVSDVTGYLRVFDEFGVKPRAIHHALEAYKMRHDLAKRGIGVSTWADWWGFKMEAYDGIPQNAAMCSEAGVRVAIHSDSAQGVQRLWYEAAKCVRWGMSEDAALRAITIHPAWQIGVDDRIGSLEKGKDADVVLFSRHPFDILTRVDAVWIDGRLVHEREER